MNYKGFDEDFRCRGMQYEVGKEFSVKGIIKVCGNGLHSCADPLDVLEYYGKPSHRYAIVEPSGDVCNACDGSKIASRTLKVLKRISRAQLFKESLKMTKVGDYIVTDGINVGSSERRVSGLLSIGIALGRTDEEIVVMSTCKFHICNWYTAIKLCENFNMLGLKWRLPSKEDIQNSNMREIFNFFGDIRLWVSTEAEHWSYRTTAVKHGAKYCYPVPFCTLKLND